MNPTTKRRQNESRAQRKRAAEQQSATWMRNFEVYTGIRGLYQDARTEWYFRSGRGKGKGNSGRWRTYFRDLEHAISGVMGLTEDKHDMELANVYKEWGVSTEKVTKKGRSNEKTQTE